MYNVVHAALAHCEGICLHNATCFLQKGMRYLDIKLKLFCDVTDSNYITCTAFNIVEGGWFGGTDKHIIDRLQSVSPSLHQSVQ